MVARPAEGRKKISGPSAGQDRSPPPRYFTGMLHLNHRIITLFTLSLSAFACDVDESPESLNVLEANEPELESPDDGLADELAAQGALEEGRAAAPAGRHCIVEATAVPHDVDPATVRIPEKSPTCFPKFADAIFAITGERIADAVTPASYEPAPRTLRVGGTPRAGYLHGIEYTEFNYKGSTLSIFGNDDCLHSAYVLKKFSDPKWDNVISSAKAFSDCKHSYHYEYTDLGGAVKDCGIACPYIGGALDNRTSSIRFTK